MDSLCLHSVGNTADDGLALHNLLAGHADCLLERFVGICEPTLTDLLPDAAVCQIYDLIGVGVAKIGRKL